MFFLPKLIFDLFFKNKLMMKGIVMPEIVYGRTLEYGTFRESGTAAFSLVAPYKLVSKNIMEIGVAATKRRN